MLFNKDGHGSEEIFELSGTFQASTPFKAIATEIDAAALALKEIVGSGVMSRAESIYEENNAPEEDEQKYLDMVRRPVAFLAICNYSKITGLSHGASGRKITVGDNEKIPFAWMVDRDDREMKERYYRAVDTLIAYLNDIQDSDWMASEAYAAASSSLISSLSQFEEVYPLEHSYYTFITLLPLILDAQYHLSVIIGADKMASIVEGEYPSALRMARQYLALSALITALKRWTISIFPLQIARQFAPSYQGNKESRTTTREEVDWTVAQFQKQLTQIQSDIISEVSGNPWSGVNLVPENDPKKKYFTV